MRKILVAGSSGSGKSSSVDSLRGRPDVIIPMRFVDRGEREKDNKLENTHVSRDVFRLMVKQGEIVHAWERNLGPERGIVHYGFAPIEDHDGLVAVYSGNNALLRSRIGRRLMSNGAIPAVVAAPRWMRAQRLARRSPDLLASEIETRLGDEPDDLLKIPGVVVIENPNALDQDGVPAGGVALNRLVDMVLASDVSLNQRQVVL
jgi:ribose 1,5-bisphosphokinase PhnN